jgi:hypothetical protein
MYFLKNDAIQIEIWIPDRSKKKELSLITQKNNFVSQNKFVSTQSITQHKNNFYNTKVEDFMNIFHIFLNNF